MSKSLKMLSFVLVVVIVLSVTPTCLNQSLAAENAGPASALARLQALASAYPQGVPVEELRASLREIVELQKRYAVCGPCDRCHINYPFNCPTYTSGSTSTGMSAPGVDHRVVVALKALEREARATTGTVSASRFETLVGSLELATQAARK